MEIVSCIRVPQHSPPRGWLDPFQGESKDGWFVFYVVLPDYVEKVALRDKNVPEIKNPALPSKAGCRVEMGKYGLFFGFRTLLGCEERKDSSAEAPEAEVWEEQEPTNDRGQAG